MGFSWDASDYVTVASAIFLATIIYFIYSTLSIVLSLFILAIPSFIILRYLNRDNDFEVFKAAIALFFILVATMIFKVLASVALGLYATTVISFLIIQHWIYVSTLSFFYDEELVYWKRDSKFYWYLISILGIVLIAWLNLGLESFLKLYHTNLSIFFNWDEFLENPDLKALEINTTIFTEDSLKSVMKGLTSKLFFFFLCMDVLVPLIKNKLNNYTFDW